MLVRGARAGLGVVGQVVMRGVRAGLGVAQDMLLHIGVNW